MGYLAELAERVFRVYGYRLAQTCPGRFLVITNASGDREVSIWLWSSDPARARTYLSGSPVAW